MLDTPPKLVPLEKLPAFSPEYFKPVEEQKPPFRWRLVIAGSLIGLGLVTAGVGVASITYRLTHLTVDSGLVNGRQVRLQAPLNGEIKDFFARPGVAVRSGQVLARLAPSSQQEQSLIQLQGEVSSKTAQLAAGRDLLNVLNRQLESLNGQDQTMQSVNVKIANDDVVKNRAAVSAAIATETAARLKYERYRKLAADGAVARQLVEQLRAEWLTAQSAVSQTKAALSSTNTSRDALEGGVPLNRSASLQEQRLSLSRSIESQKSAVKTLEAQLATSQKQLEQAKALLSDRRDFELTAPFAGVIYTTERDAGEQVNRPDVLLTLLDCNDLWVETLVNAEQANRIDATKPVRVQMVGESNTLVGQVELIEAMSRAELAKDQARTLLPTVPTQLTGQPIARVVVRIPPATQQGEAQKLCGVGQTASLTFNLKLFNAR